MSLRDELEAAGLTVQTVTGWGARGYQWAAGKPVGVMIHHTAPPVPFPVDRLYGSLLKCNINTKPDGTVWLIAQGACNYSSGSGSSIVLTDIRNGVPPVENARERGLTDDMNGNPYFFNFENDHPGDGSPLPQVQFDAIVTATRVVLDHYDLTPGHVLSHAEWTYRKRDPYWNGSLRAIEAIRQALEDEVITRTDKADDGLAALKPTYDAMVAAGVFTDQTQPGGVAFNDEVAVFLSRFETYLKNKYGFDAPSEVDIADIAAALKIVPGD